MISLILLKEAIQFLKLQKIWVTGDMIVQWNELKNPEVIYPGQVLDIKFSDLKVN